MKELQAGCKGRRIFICVEGTTLARGFFDVSEVWVVSVDSREKDPIQLDVRSISAIPEKKVVGLWYGVHIARGTACTGSLPKDDRRQSVVVVENIVQELAYMVDVLIRDLDEDASCRSKQIASLARGDRGSM